MGHKRQAPPPSPLRMLAMLDARGRGIPLPEIAKRTKHSISSIMRWTDKFGPEVRFLHALHKAYPDMQSELSFDLFYPKSEQAAPADSVELSLAADIEARDWHGDELHTETKPDRIVLF